MTDQQKITLMRGLRQTAYSMLAVTLAVALSQRGLSPAAIGALVTTALVGDLIGTLVIGRYADNWGRRQTLCALAVLMALTGLVFAVSSWYPLLLLAAFIGTLGTAASETASFLPIDQAIMGQLIEGPGRTAIFARYNLVASLAGAAGALLVALPGALARWGVAAGSQSMTQIWLAFGLYILAGLAVAALAISLSPAVEATNPLASAEEASIPIWRRLLPPLPHSHGLVLKLAALFCVDAAAGALVNQTLLALYFHLRFGADLTALGALFFGANLLAALSFLAAPWLAKRFGLLNTMVFTHLPSNVLLMLVALAPTFPVAAGLLLARQSLSQLDVPTRQAYTMAMVTPSERTAAASVTSLARSSGAAGAPVIGGALLQGPLVVLGLPLLLAGGIKIAYDITLWLVFRRAPDPTGERKPATSRA